MAKETDTLSTEESLLRELMIKKTHENASELARELDHFLRSTQHGDARVTALEMLLRNLPVDLRSALFNLQLFTNTRKGQNYRDLKKLANKVSILIKKGEDENGIAEKTGLSINTITKLKSISESGPGSPGSSWLMRFLADKDLNEEFTRRKQRPSGQNTTRATYSLSEEMAEAIKAAAAKRGVTASRFIEETMGQQPDVLDAIQNDDP